MSNCCKLDTHYDIYEPINALKLVDTNIWIVDGKTIDFRGVAFPTRMTVIRLRSGGLFVHSPTELTPELKHQIDSLGPVEHLVSPNRIHYWWIGQWGEAYPTAVKWASPEVEEAIQSLDWKFDRKLANTDSFPWDEEIRQLRVTGSRFLEEYVFFHEASKTLILADLIENFELDRVPSRWERFLLSCAGNTDPDGKLPIDLRFSYFGRHDQLSEAINTMITWQPRRVIVAHGRWYSQDGVNELKRAFRWVKGVK